MEEGGGFQCFPAHGFYGEGSISRHLDIGVILWSFLKTPMFGVFLAPKIDVCQNIIESKNVLVVRNGFKMLFGSF